MAEPVADQLSIDDFRQLVAQPLLLQSPLQAVLELLFGSLKAQEKAIGDLQGQLRSLDAREREGREALTAAAAERTQGAATALQQLEERVLAQQAATAQELRETDARLHHLETQLHGASNLAGRQIALDDIASMLGVDVPQVVPQAAEFRQLASEGDHASPAPATGGEALGGSGDAAGHSHAMGNGVPAPAEEEGSSSSPDAQLSTAAAEADTGQQQLDMAAGPAAPHNPDDRRSTSSSKPSSERGSATGSPAGKLARSSQQAGGGSFSPGPARRSGHVSPAQPSRRASRAASPVPRRGSSVSGGGGAIAGAGRQRSGSGQAAAEAPVHEEHGGSANSMQPPAAAGASPQQPAINIPSPASLLSTIQAGRTRTAPSDQQPHLSTAQTSAQLRGSAAQGLGGTLGTLQGEAADGDSRLSSAAGGNDSAGMAGAEAPDAAAAKAKSDASRKLLEVINLLRRRPNLQQSGLLWKLQASLHDTAEEQERLKREVEGLREQLQALHTASGSGLEQCNQRIDTVEVAVAAATAAADSGGGSAASSARDWKPPVPAAELKALEDRVKQSAEQLAELDSRVRQGAEHLAQLGSQVKEGSQRLTRLEERQEASTAAVTLARASSSGSAGDTLAALQGHLLSQQQRLQAHMDSLAAGIRQSIPEQVHDAVTGSVTEIGKGLERRMSERLATKQDLQNLSAKVSSKASKEDLERLLRAHRTAVGGSPPTADGGAGPAAGIRFKCISCDGDLQPFVFAAGAGSGVYQNTADLRYSQLPVASPPRAPGQPWAASAVPVGSPGGGVATAEPSRLSSSSGGSGGGGSGGVMTGQHLQAPSPKAASLSGRVSTGSASSRLGAPVSWMHRMRRETGAGQEGLPMSRRESLASQDLGAGLLPQPSLTTAGISRPQTAAPLQASSSVAADTQPPGQQDAQDAGAEFYAAIREEPLPAAGSTGGGATASPSAVSLPRHHTSKSDGGGGMVGSGSKGSLPALCPSPGRIKALRPSTALPGTAPTVADWNKAAAAVGLGGSVDGSADVGSSRRPQSSSAASCGGPE